MTLIPVSNISVVGVRASTVGASRWIGQRSTSSGIGVAEIDRLAQQVEDPPERHPADRHGDRATGVDHFGAPGQAVGGVHRDRPNAVVAEVLLDLADQVRILLGGRMSRSSSAAAARAAGP